MANAMHYNFYWSISESESLEGYIHLDNTIQWKLRLQTMQKSNKIWLKNVLEFVIGNTYSFNHIIINMCLGCKFISARTGKIIFLHIAHFVSYYIVW
jgi:hypothetical protein